MKVRLLVTGQLLCVFALLAWTLLPGCQTARVQTQFDPNKGYMNPSGLELSRDAGAKGLDFGLQPAKKELGAAPTPNDEEWLSTVRGVRGGFSWEKDDEIVVVPRDSKDKVQLTAADVPGSGQLMTRDAKSQKNIAVPLKHTDVHADISAYVATVDVTQQYTNPYNEKIEAVYVFPLPQDAAVNEFVMTIGDRKIRGIIREREEAEKIYQEAKRQGYVASLLTQERPNIFTQSIANIEPGKAIDITIKYFHTLSYVDGWFEFVFPMVVGPRFNPPGYKEGVGALPRGANRNANQSTNVQYLRPDERSGSDISLSVHIDAGLKIEQIDSRNHKIEAFREGDTIADVKLASSDSIPNKDFVLRYKAAGDVAKTALLTHRDERGGFFTLLIVPPDSLKSIPRHPLEMVFTLDVSGSMSGAPIEQSKAAIRYALTHMQPDDTFQVIRFASNSDQMTSEPVSPTRENVKKALQFIEDTQAGGGTMMMEGIHKSLNFPNDESRLRFVAFLTDGFIGNDQEILGEVRKCRGDSRIFSFGVGSSPNRFLLDGMARLGRGTVAYLGLNDDANKIMADYFERISHPAMTNLSLDFGDMNATEIYPSRLPDLFVGRPVVITGRYTNDHASFVRINGKVGGANRTIEVPIDPTNARQHAGLAAVWARGKIADLYDKAFFEPSDALPGEIKSVALQYGLMSNYTAFIAVDSSQKTAGDHGTTVAVPVPVPDGVRYDTTVPERVNNADAR